MHLIGLQPVRNRAHLLVDVVVPHALREGRELTLDVRDVLTAERGRAEFLGTRSVTGRACRYPTLGIPGKYQADRRISLPETVSGFGSTFCGDRRQSGTMREIG